MSKKIEAEYQKTNTPDETFKHFLKETVKASNTDWKLTQSIKDSKEQIILGYYWEGFLQNKSQTNISIFQFYIFI